MNVETLRSEVRKIQGGVVSSAQKVWHAGLGTVSRVEAEGSGLFDRLVERGRGLESRGLEQVKRTRGRVEAGLEDALEGVTSVLDRQITGVLHRFGVPSHNEVRALRERVEALSRQLDKLEEAPPAPAERAPAARPSPRKVYHVVPFEDGWKVEAENAARATSLHSTKDEALAAARDLAKNQEPSQVVVHRMDGTIQTSYTYGDSETN